MIYETFQNGIHELNRFWKHKRILVRIRQLTVVIAFDIQVAWCY